MAKKIQKRKFSFEESSNIKKLKYNSSTQELTTKFQAGGKYLYKGVTQEEFDNILWADSVGKAHLEIIVKS